MSDTNPAVSQEMQHLIFLDILPADGSDFIPVINGPLIPVILTQLCTDQLIKSYHALSIKHIVLLIAKTVLSTMVSLCEQISYISL